MGWQAAHAAQGEKDYLKAVPVILRYPEEERETRLHVSIVCNSAKTPTQAVRCMRLQLTHDDELFFLHFLDVTDDDFQVLKAEQGIVVDFHSFPDKIVSLLERCTGSTGPWPSRFHCVLTITGGQSVLKIVETNDFKQLAHISLLFRAGNDSAIKEHLAAQLREAKSRLTQLSAGLTDCQAERAALQSRLAELELTSSRQANEGAGREDALRREASRLEADLQERHSRELRGAAEAFSSKQRVAQEACDRLEAENRASSAETAELARRLAEATRAIAALEASARGSEAALLAAEARAGRAAQESADHAETSKALRHSLSALEEKARTGAEALQASDRREKQLKDAVASLETRSRELKELGSTHEQRASEAVSDADRSRSLINRLTDLYQLANANVCIAQAVPEDLRLAREKISRKQNTIQRQELELETSKQSIRSAADDSQHASSTLTSMHKELRDLKEDNKRLRTELEGCTKQLQSNEQMIRWLNNQVNEAHMGVGLHATSLSRHGRACGHERAREPLRHSAEQPLPASSKFKSTIMQHLAASQARSGPATTSV